MAILHGSSLNAYLLGTLEVISASSNSLRKGTKSQKNQIASSQDQSLCEACFYSKQEDAELVQTALVLINECMLRPQGLPFVTLKQQGL
mmetsp:Transcript_1000/g.2487  ORF Transcript_1000/g.2487 Transcript_1000/m.2487 type:complete len:89 (+) Transcript_1000:1026-1292(+)